MEAMFQEIIILVEGKIKKAYICKCLIPGENGESNYCNIKSGSFKAQITHLKKHHSILLPDSIICHQHEIILSTPCLIISHFKDHILQACNTFNYEGESDQCETCKNNIINIKMCRPGMSCIV